MIAIDMADKAAGLSFWAPKEPLATALVRKLGNSGYIYQFGIPLTRESARTMSTYPDMATAVSRAVAAYTDTFYGTLLGHVSEAFIMEDGYVGANKKTSLMIADLRGRVANQLLRDFPGIIELPRPQPDEWRASVSATLAPGMVWGKARKEKKAQMLEIARRTWPTLARMGVLTDDEGDSLGIGHHWYCSGGYFAKAETA